MEFSILQYINDIVYNKNMKDSVLKIADFTTTPGPRYRKWGDFSGEEFREEHFIPWLKEHKNDTDTKLIADLNGAVGYPPSFLEETFGGAIRKGYLDQVKNIEIVYSIEYKKEEIQSYIERAERALRSDKLE